MTLLQNFPESWGPWNHASLTSISKKNAEIKVGIREGFSIKGILSLKKHFELKKCRERQPYNPTGGTVGTLLGNLIGWIWLRSEIYPKHMKFLHPYYFSHPRPLGRSFSDFLWEELVKLGLCTLTQGDVSVKHKKTIVRFQWRLRDKHVYGVVEKISGKGKIQLEIVGVKCKTYPKPLESFEQNYYQVQVFDDMIRFSTDLSATIEDIEEIINQKEEMPYGIGAIKDALEGILTIIGINSLKTPDRGWLTSLMRRFGVIAGGWTIYQWDNSFVGMMSALYYPQLAKGNIKALCSDLTFAGFIPNQANPFGRAESITQIPVTSYCALKVSKILSEDMSDMIPALESNNNYWLKTHDPNGFHLLSYGSMMRKKCAAALRQTAIYEAGMDNHPMFDKIPVDYDSGCLAVYSVGLNSIYALDCWALSELAKTQGNHKLAKKLEIRYQNMRKVINKHLWDGEMYRNRYWNGDFQDLIVPNLLWPLIAGVPTREQAESTVKKVFKTCLSPYGISNAPIDHPSFKQQISWRGRILPPIQFLTSESLRRYEFDLEASDLAKRTYRCFSKEWIEESHTHESYNGMTGDGDDVSITGEPNHPWACLMAYLAVQDFIDYEVWNGLRVGRLEPINASVNGIPINRKNYSVSILDKEIIINRGGKQLVKASHPLILRSFVHEKEMFSCRYKTLKPLDIEIFVAQGNYEVKVGDELYKEQVDQRNKIVISLNPPKNYINIRKL